MKVATTLAIVLLCAAVRGANIEVEDIYLDALLDSARKGPGDLQQTVDAFQALRGQPSRAPTLANARTRLIAAFKTHFINGAAQGAVGIADFAQLESAVGAFGPDQAELVRLLKSSTPPGAWERSDFINYVREKLALIAQSATAHSDIVLNPATDLSREAFLLEVCPDPWQESIVQHFRRNLWEPTPASGMEVLLQTADKLRAHRPFTERVAPPETKGLGNRLFPQQVTEWLKTKSLLERLIGASDHSVTNWHIKLSTALRTKSVTRSKELGATLNRLSVLHADASTPMRQLDCQKDSAWLEWLHEEEAIQTVFSRRGGEGERRSMIDHLRTLVANPAEFDRFYKWLKTYYYEYEAERVFGDKDTDKEPNKVRGILRPHAQSDQTQPIINDVLTGLCSPDHRATLGSDLLSNHNCLEPAWRGSQPRLDLATSLYLQLRPVPNLNRLGAQQELDRPLLGALLRGILEVFRSRDASKIEIVKAALKRLSPHLLALKRQGGRPSESQALKELDAEVLRMLQEARAGLKTLSMSSDSQAMHGPVTGYVDTLKLALEFHQLLSEAFDVSTPGWLEQAATDLRRDVFNLPEKLADGTVLYWPDQTARFRANILMKLDSPLRECLTEVKLLLPSGDLFFSAFYLPLLRVHGFTTLLGSTTPHEFWVIALAQDQSRQRKALDDTLRMMATSRYLDADEFLLRIAKLRLTLLHVGKNAWQVRPEELFGPAWDGVNANVRLLKKLLDAQPPPLNDTLQLQIITQKVLDDLGTNAPINGPKFPAGTAESTDAREPIVGYLPWVQNLVQALEWQSSPIKDAAVTKDWTESVKASGRRDGLPFVFTPPTVAGARAKLHGGPRLSLVRLWSAANQLDEGAHAALFLPNHQENNAEPDRLADYKNARQDRYAALAQRWEEKPDFATLRTLMRLSMSARTPLTPAYEAIRNAVPQPNEKDWHAANELRSIDEERSLIEQLLSQTSDDPKVRARALIDGCTAARLPETWTKATKLDREKLLTSSFKQRLETMSESNITTFLKLRGWLRVLADATDTNKISKLAAEDGVRVQRFLSFLDYCLWYSRGDFTGSECLFEKPKDKSSSGIWYPVLPLFAVADEAVVHAAIETTSGELQAELKRASFLLHDAMFTLVKRVSEHRDAQAMLTFGHHVSWQALDFRLLYERHYEEEADAKTLAHQALVGVLRNFDLSGESLTAQPDDARVYSRLFERMDSFLPEDWRRMDLAPFHPTLDGSISLAAGWADGTRPTALALKEAAEKFMRNMPPNFRLLRGAKTLSGGVLPSLAKLMERSEELHSRAYADIYPRLLFQDGKVVSAGFYQDLAEPLHRLPMMEQRKEFDVLIRYTEKLFAQRNSSPFQKAWIVALPAAVEPLVKGRPDRSGKQSPAQEYLWKPADEFEKLEGPQSAPPKPFLDLAKWWTEHERTVKNPLLLNLFKSDKGSDGTR